MTTVTQQSIVNPQERFKGRHNTRFVLSANTTLDETFNGSLLSLNCSGGVTLTFPSASTCVGVCVKGVVTTAGSLTLACSTAAQMVYSLQSYDVTADEHHVAFTVGSNPTALTAAKVGSNFEAVSDGKYWLVVVNAEVTLEG